MEKLFRETRLMPIVKIYEQQIGSSFKPNKNTYDRLGVSRKRLGMLISGDAKTPLKADEINSFSKFFGVTTDQILQSN